MPKVHHPHRGSMQFWPRKRSRHSLVRIRSWAAENKAKPLGFIGYKAGMTHLLFTDNRTKSLTKGEDIFCPVSIVECPPMKVAGVAFYKKSADGLKKSATIMSPNPDKELVRKISLVKKSQSLENLAVFDDLRLLVYSTPAKTGIGTKKPKMIELALGGNKEEKLNYAKQVMGKEINVSTIFEAGNQVDVHGVNKGKGWQGTVKRMGVPLRQHKAEKTKRGIATLGSWTPKRVEFTVAQAGKMGYHLRTEYNKLVMKIGDNGAKVTPTGGIPNYGVVKNNYLLLKGSIVGPQKRALVLTPAIRPNHKIPKTAPEVRYLSVSN
ncbi:MAG TPA: 50S ribosomal protein L3 [Candidatus Nanoarchaeia archaeon]|nr:50S ribosomal protein L3 [Candidatus Nanoarchaeia archaeon]